MNRLEMPEPETTRIRIYHQETPRDDRKSHRTIVILSVSDVHFVGIAKCDKRDQFCKKTGRLIAYGRAKKARAMQFSENIGGGKMRKPTRPDLAFCAVVHEEKPHVRRLTEMYERYDKLYGSIENMEYTAKGALESIPGFMFAKGEKKDATV